MQSRLAATTFLVASAIATSSFCASSNTTWLDCSWHQKNVTLITAPKKLPEKDEELDAKVTWVFNRDKGKIYRYDDYKRMLDDEDVVKIADDVVTIQYISKIFSTMNHTAIYIDRRTLELTFTQIRSQDAPDVKSLFTAEGHGKCAIIAPKPVTENQF